MDRLLCGDVGYGKTEVALRAAFKAVMDGKQVAILVPTTVLAQQHYETFSQRLAAFPSRWRCSHASGHPGSRPRSSCGLGLGEIDIVIGTHRLLSADVQFKDLGLVIIDEEQRFGVTHKEHLKKLRTEVDVLTLTATPIPAHAVYGAYRRARHLESEYASRGAAAHRDAHVAPTRLGWRARPSFASWSAAVRCSSFTTAVNTIDAMRAHLGQLVPEARVDVGHGQMPEHRAGRPSCIVSTPARSISCSPRRLSNPGLDIPNANTLIVDRADTFGLAQLYQLRGRVGRGAARAYAYFFRHRKLSAHARCTAASGGHRREYGARRWLLHCHARSGDPWCGRVARHASAWAYPGRRLPSLHAPAGRRGTPDTPRTAGPHTMSNPRTTIETTDTASSWLGLGTASLDARHRGPASFGGHSGHLYRRQRFATSALPPRVADLRMRGKSMRSPVSSPRNNSARSLQWYSVFYIRCG